MNEHSHRFGASSVILLCLLLVAFGCSSPVWLAVDTQPAGSRVTIEGDDPGAVRDRVAPFSHELKPASDSALYVIAVEPPDAEADRWERTSVKMSAAELRALPAARGAEVKDARQLTVKLDKKPLAMLVTTKPAAAQVAVKNTLGQPLAIGPAPLAVSFFPVQEGEQLTIEVKPEAAVSDRFDGRTLKMTVADIRRLPAMSGDMGRRRLDVDLGELNVALVVESRPAQATLAVKDSSGEVLAEGPSPLSVSLAPRNGAEVLTFTAEPTGPAAGRYEPASKDLTFEYVRTLSRADERSPRRIAVDLKEAPYTIVRELVTYHGDGGDLRAAVLPSRAFRDIAEAGSTVPTRLIDFGMDLTVEGLSLSPDGQRIAFAAADMGVKADVGDADLPMRRSTLQAVRTEPGGGVQHITADNFRDRTPAFTRDGKWLLFASDRRRRDGMDLLRISAEANRGGIADIYIDQRGANVSHPSHAPNGTIAFMMDAREAAGPARRFQVWTVGGPNQFPSQITHGSEPAISPDGSLITYIAADGNLWIVGADGVGATQLTFDADRIRDAYLQSLSATERQQHEALASRDITNARPYACPGWSADSQFILYASMEGRDSTGRPNHDIWVTRPDGTGKQQLTTNGSADKYPLLSRDNRTLYFLSNRGGYWALWRIPVPQISG